MDRRALLKTLGGATIAAPMMAASGGAAACEATVMIAARKGSAVARADGPTAAILLYPGFSAVDVASARQMLESHGASNVVLLSAGPPTAAVRSDIGLAIQPDAAMEAAGKADMLFVPGGAGARAAMARPDVMAFLSGQGRAARKVAATGEAALMVRKAGIIGAKIARDGEGGSITSALFA